MPFPIYGDDAIAAVALGLVGPRTAQLKGFYSTLLQSIMHPWVVSLVGQSECSE